MLYYTQGDILFFQKEAMVASRESLEALDTSILRKQCEDRAYAELRTGLTFKSIRRELAWEQRARKRRGDYMYVTRSTVLGRLFQHKQELFRRTIAEHIERLSREELIEILAKGNGKVLASILNGGR